LTTEETIKARELLAERAGLELANGGKAYLLDGEWFCERADWQPDFCADHALMALGSMFVISEVLMERNDGGDGMRFRFSGVVAHDKPYIRTGWEDSMAGALFDAEVQALQMEGKV
jgi:hypothetical protein